MIRFSTTRPAALALAAGLAIATAIAMAETGAAQPPFKKDGPPKFGTGDRNQPGKGFPGQDENRKFDGRKGPGSDPIVDAWLRVLIEKITDPHDTVRESARGAIVAVGDPALPMLHRLADGDDPAKAVAARKMIQAIEGRRGPPGQPGRPGFDGFGGFGGPGFPGLGNFGPPGKGPNRPGGMGGFNPPGKGPRRDGDGDRDRDRDPKRDRRENVEPIPVAPFPGQPGRSRRGE